MSHPTLKINHRKSDGDQHHIRLEWRQPGQADMSVETTLDFTLPDQDQNDLRWYLEEYLQQAHEPEKEIATRIEARIEEMGTDLFRGLFKNDDDGRELWTEIKRVLGDTRIEVSSGVEENSQIPWELLRDPKTEKYLAISAHTFCRSQTQTADRAKLPHTQSGPIRILLVITRPSAGEDVPFRSVAMPLLKGLTEANRQDYQLDVLRPPTFARLGEVLRAAKNNDAPYHVVHFDGHGAYIDIDQEAANQDQALRMILQSMTSLTFSPDLAFLKTPRVGKHGYLLFENPDHSENLQLVDGPTIGKLLYDTDVPVLLLNACRSAHSTGSGQAHAESDTDDEKDQPTAAKTDVHGQVRAFGSLAQEIVDCGVAGVLAMRYNLYVVTAVQLVGQIYKKLASGLTLGQAVSEGRKFLADKPQRTLAYRTVTLQDWLVPIVYEAQPLHLFPKKERHDISSLILSDRPDGFSKPVGSGAALSPDLPPEPDAGFFGRDETLLALDRAFDSQPIVLLHAYAGSGKTATAAEFARWYAQTGGLAGPVLFTSFEQYKPLPRVLDPFGALFGPALEQSGLHWLALDDDARRNVALTVMQQVPLLWIWDNVEPVTGFPAGSDTPWSADEQRALVDFLRAARATKAKFLLTSRRPEHDWLANLPRRIAIPPMPMPERMALAAALAQKHGAPTSDLQHWRPLLRFTRGNPLTITVLVGQALRDGRRTAAQISEFVDQLRTGEAAFDDEASQGRSRSLGASLSYGFDQTFTDPECKALALLYFFQGFLRADALHYIGHPDLPGRLEEMDGFSTQDAVQLLDRAAEVGLLTKLGSTYYTIHPALPWYFKRLFETHYPGPEDQERASRAFVEAMGELGNHYFRQYEGGNREVIGILRYEEPNLLHARQLALRQAQDAAQHNWYRPIISAMQGLRQLYDHTGRRAEWARLVDEIVPLFVDPTTDGPLPDREEDWGLVCDYRVRLAWEQRDWATAERLQKIRVEFDRQRAMAVVPGWEGEDMTFLEEMSYLDDDQRHRLHSLAASLHELGQIQREQGESSCVSSYEQSHEIARAIGDQPAAAAAAFNLGNAYWGQYVPDLRDLDQAERWYRRSLEMYEEHHKMDRAQCIMQLGAVAYERFQDSRQQDGPEAELLKHLNQALDYYQQALKLLPPDAVNDLAVTHNAMGVIYKNAGQMESALSHFRQSIRYMEQAGDFYGAGGTRYNVALALAQTGRFADALAYARQARQDFARYGQGAAKDVADTDRLIAAIEQQM